MSKTAKIKLATQGGVQIISRYDVPQEIDEMQKMVKSLGRERLYISYIFNDSKAGRSYTIGIDPIPRYVDRLMLSIFNAMIEVIDGHNGVVFCSGGYGDIWKNRLGEFDPFWASDLDDWSKS